MTHERGYTPEERAAFHKRFSELVADFGESNEALSNLLFNDPTYDRALYNYQIGANMPLKRVIYTIAHHFKVSYAYLIGHTNIRGEPEDHIKRLIDLYGPQVPAKWKRLGGKAYVDRRIRVNISPTRPLLTLAPSASEPTPEPEPEPAPRVISANGKEVIGMNYVGDGQAHLRVDGVFPYETASAVMALLHPA